MKKAPDFSLYNQQGEITSLQDFAGKWLVLYFYPKDNTPGCTTEACNFRDAREAIHNYGNAEVVGISKDTVDSHRKFADKHSLNFTLLSDETGDTIRAYGAWGQRSIFGKKLEGILRNTYLINPDGEIVKVYEKVDPADHAAQIVSDLRSLQTAQ